ncbi:hypothetical protein MN116_000304, partial [Schistosoma mekongi]
PHKYDKTIHVSTHRHHHHRHPHRNITRHNVYTLGRPHKYDKTIHVSTHRDHHHRPSTQKHYTTQCMHNRKTTQIYRRYTCQRIVISSSSIHTETLHDTMYTQSEDHTNIKMTIHVSTHRHHHHRHPHRNITRHNVYTIGRPHKYDKTIHVSTHRHHHHRHPHRNITRHNVYTIGRPNKYDKTIHVSTHRHHHHRHPHRNFTRHNVFYSNSSLLSVPSPGYGNPVVWRCRYIKRCYPSVVF